MTLALLAWARAFVFTQIVEAPIYRRLLGVRWAAALGASALTHPNVWFVFPWLGRRLDVGYVPMVVAAEVFAWLAEAAFLTQASRAAPAARGWRVVLAGAFAANAASVALGLGSRRLFGVP